MTGRVNNGANPSFNKGDVVYFPDAVVTEAGPTFETRKGTVAGALNPSSDTVPVRPWELVDRKPNTRTPVVPVPSSMLFDPDSVTLIARESLSDHRSPEWLAADPPVSERLGHELAEVAAASLLLRRELAAA